MAESTINTPLKGLNLDLDYSVVDNNTITLPSKNFRLIDKEGHGLVLTIIKGNTRDIDFDHPDGEEFKISDGFIVIGWCEYDDILYIVSYNEDTGESEIGCFPSYNDIEGVWEAKYRPLQNYDRNNNGVAGAFRTSLFEYDKEAIVNVIAKFSYDGSVDLYLCDGIRPNRVVNTGFNSKTGKKNDIVYVPEDFNGKLNQIPFIKKNVNISLVGIVDGGKLKYGNYYIYVRYVTKNFNRTDIVGDDGVYCVYRGDGSIKGTYGGNITDESDKKIVLKIKNLDTTYDYLEIVLVRYYSDGNNVLFKDINLIDRLYSISSSEIDIEIYGSESMIPISEMDILTVNINQRTCKHHTIAYNRYFGVNWSNPPRRYDLLNVLASKIRAVPHTELIPDSVDINRENIYNQYRNYRQVYEKVGYFRREIYKFGVVFIFKDGTESQSFAVKGWDYVDNKDTIVDGNETGIVRMPDYYSSGDGYKGWLYYDGGINILGIRFVQDEMFNYINNNLSESDKEWFLNNISGYFFVRANRKKHLLYQGIAVMCSTGGMSKYSNGKEYKKEFSGYNWKNLQYMYDTMAVYREFYPENSFEAFASSNDKWASVSGNVLMYDLYEVYNINSLMWSYKFWNKNEVVGNSLYGLLPEKDMDMYDRALKLNEGLLPEMPIFNFLYPCLAVRRTNIDYEYTYYSLRSFPTFDTYAIISPDFMMDKVSEDIDNYFIMAVSPTLKFKDMRRSGATTYYIAEDPSSDSDNNVMETPVSIYYHQLLNNDYYDRPLSPVYKIGDDKIKAIYKVGEGRYLLPTDISADNRFVNRVYDYATSYYVSNSEVMYTFAYASSFANQLNNEKKVNSNRNMFVPKYIGIVFNSSDSVDWKFFNHRLVNVYNREDVDNKLVKQWYNNSDLLYRIGDNVFVYNNNGVIGNVDDTVIERVSRGRGGMKAVEDSKYSNEVRFDGDCFLQRTWFKIMSWDYSRFKDKDGVEVGVSISSVGGSKAVNDSHSFGSTYRHGVLLSIVTENSNNISMRTDSDYKFYPKIGSIDWAFEPNDNSRGTEAFLLNRGYNNTLGIKFYVSYDPKMPEDFSRKPTRIRYSAEQIIGSYIDAFRDFDVSAYEDYDLQFGEMLTVHYFGNRLITIQEKCVNEHVLGSTDIKLPTNIGDVVVKNPNILGKAVRHVMMYGTQHQSSVKQIEDSIYFVDWNKKAICRLKVDYDKLNPIVTGDIISLSGRIDKYLYDIEKSININEIKSNKYGDYPLKYNGIIAGYDVKHSEVFWTFLHSKMLNINIGGKKIIFYMPTLYKTLLFNHKLNIFLGEVDYYSHIYMNLKNSLYSCYIASDERNRNNVYKHDVGEYLKMYGSRREACVTFVVNCHNENNTAVKIVEKLFTNIRILTNHIDFKKIVFETDNNKSELNPFSTGGIEFWRDPEWFENYYYCTIPSQSVDSSNEFFIDSNLRGTWLKVSIYYDVKDGYENSEKFIKFLITDYIISNV